MAKKTIFSGLSMENPSTAPVSDQHQAEESAVSKKRTSTIKKKEQLCIRLSANSIDKIKEIAEREGISMSKVVETGIEEYLKCN